MGTGTYEEPLGSKGKLKVTKRSWEISYYFPGPDLRYNGTFISVPGEKIELYISAFIDNWAEYEKLKATVPKGGDFSKRGKMGMTIRIGKFSEGVCLKNFYMCIGSVKQLETVISRYRKAAERAAEIQKFLASS